MDKNVFQFVNTFYQFNGQNKHHVCIIHIFICQQIQNEFRFRQYTMLDKIVNRVVKVLANGWMGLIKMTTMRQYTRIMRCSADFVDFGQKVDTTSFCIINAFATRKLVTYTADDKEMNNAC